MSEASDVIGLTQPVSEVAEAHDLKYDVEIARDRVVKPKAYADNFRTDRADNWTH